MKIVCFGQLAVGLESITIPFTTHAVGDDRPPEGANPPSESARIPRARTYYVYNSKKKKKKNRRYNDDNHSTYDNANHLRRINITTNEIERIVHCMSGKK